MSRRLPPVTWLRAFESAARHLSFTAAAAELNLTQAAISKQVKQLELYLREPLFERRARSLALTKMGAAYLPKVRDGFERLSAGTEEVFGGRASPVLSIRVPVSFGVSWLAPRLGRFMEARPDVPLRIVSSVWNDDASAARYDLDIRYGSGRWPGYRAERLTWDVAEPLCAPGYVSAPQDLLSARLLHVLGYEEGWATWSRAAGLSGLDVGRGMQVDTTVIAMELAAQGLGVALGRSSLAGRHVQDGRLVRPFDIAVPLDEGFHALVPEEGGRREALLAFQSWLREEAADSGVAPGDRQCAPSKEQAAT